MSVGASVVPDGVVSVVLPCSDFCITGDSVSSIVGVLALCFW